MSTVAKLKDGSEIVIRSMSEADLDKSFAFFQALAPEDREYLRRDVTQREVVEQRIQLMESARVRRLVALADEEIVADGALELTAPGWKESVGELRLIVASAYRRKGLGMLMARELFRLAAREKVEQIVVKMMRPQTAARSIFRKLGFREEVLLPEYVKDLSGKKQDLILMRCDLEALWQTMEDYLLYSDWVRTR